MLKSSSPANRLQALALINDSYKYFKDPTMNGVVVTDAIKFVQTNKEKITMACKEGIKESKEPDYDEERSDWRRTRRGDRGTQ
jgi:hypothetical protein